MEQSEIPITAAEQSKSEKPVRPILALGMEDVGNLDDVLRGYYLSQIKSLEKRKDRKLARKLLENHLVLPKSRQRTSKDTAYIKEILGIDFSLLEKLEESRLIRRIHKSGNNPIYEISHDTLVEPILAERKGREVIARFIKKTWKYIALLLLLWFLFGMWFENTFEVIPTLPQEPQSIDIVMDKQVLGIGKDPTSFLLPLPPIVINQELKPSDSIFIKVPIDPIRLTRLSPEEKIGSDTISINLANPIEIPINAKDLPQTYQTFSDVVVPLAYSNSGSGNSDANRIFAKLSGNLKMTTKAGRAGRAGSAGSAGKLDGRLEPIVMELGDTLVRMGKSSKSVPVNFSLRLTDFFEDENDKNSIRNVLGDRLVNLNYTVKVRPTRVAPPPAKIEYPSVEGIEVQYSDGTSRLIRNDDSTSAGETEKIHVVAAGETLFSIAKKYGLIDEKGNTSTKELKQLNALQSNTLFVGQALRIPDQ